MKTHTDYLAKRDLLNARDAELIPYAAYQWHNTSNRVAVHNADGMDFLLDTLLSPNAEPVTVSLSLKQAGEERKQGPANLYFSVNQQANVAAAALVAADNNRTGHQWYTSGNAWTPTSPVLAEDPHIPYDTPFPTSAYVTIEQLRPAVHEFAWGNMLPPPSMEWTTVSEADIRWHWLG